MKNTTQMASPYLYSLSKRLLDVLVSLLILLITAPLIVLLSLLVFITSGAPVFFIHKRTGKDGKTIKIIKFRSMVKNAEKIKSKFSKLNESDGPTFKIKEDPRFTPIGKILSATGLDELPQFINVLVGEMSIVGPRPLPISEAKRLTREQKVRELAKPGITSTWVVNGSHKMAFKKWMDLDGEYVKNASLALDLKVMVQTFKLMLRSLFVQIVNH